MVLWGFLKKKIQNTEGMSQNQMLHFSFCSCNPPQNLTWRIWDEVFTVVWMWNICEQAVFQSYPTGQRKQEGD